MTPYTAMRSFGKWRYKAVPNACGADRSDFLKQKAALCLILQHSVKLDKLNITPLNLLTNVFIIR